MYMNTIDLDFITKEEFERVHNKILFCPDLVSLTWYDTAKGIHVKLVCKKECDLCRMVFDDQTRYARDLERAPSSRNVLHQKKWLIRNGKEQRVW